MSHLEMGDFLCNLSELRMLLCNEVHEEVNQAKDKTTELRQRRLEMTTNPRI